MGGVGLAHARLEAEGGHGTEEAFAEFEQRVMGGGRVAAELDDQVDGFARSGRVAQTEQLARGAFQLVDEHGSAGRG